VLVDVGDDLVVAPAVQVQVGQQQAGILAVRVLRQGLLGGIDGETALAGRGRGPGRLRQVGRARPAKQRPPDVG
jgi:hypothetical protein